jgi:hypothetical protein
MPAAKQVQAITSFAGAVGEDEYIVHAGDVFASTHPVVKAHPELFEAEAPVASAPKRRSRKTT